MRYRRSYRWKLASESYLSGGRQAIFAVAEYGSNSVTAEKKFHATCTSSHPLTSVTACYFFSLRNVHFCLFTFAVFFLLHRVWQPVLPLLFLSSFWYKRGRVPIFGLNLPLAFLHLLPQAWWPANFFSFSYRYLTNKYNSRSFPIFKNFSLLLLRSYIPLEYHCRYLRFLICLHQLSSDEGEGDGRSRIKK